MLSGDNGILQKAGQAKDDTIIGQEKEQVELAYVSAAVKKLGKNVSDQDLQDELDISVGNGKTLVAPNSDTTLNVLFHDTDHNYNINGGVVSKAETEEEIVARLLQYFQNDWMDEDTGGFANIAPITDANTSIGNIHQVFNDDNELVIQYIYYKGKYFQVTLNNDLKATNVESKSNCAMILDGNQKVEILPQMNLTWYDWASDTNNTQDLNFKYGNSYDEISLKELIIKVHNDYYNNSSEIKSINLDVQRKNGFGYIALMGKDGIGQDFDTIIKQNEVYEIIRGIY
ncbi:MAG: hypothetical protein ILA02_05935 [Clostridia bacterium]|nr:hypothetical protein [Clostridia bacterium]